MDETEQPDTPEVPVADVTTDGQLTIPKQIREKLGLEGSETVTFREAENGDIVIERVPTVREMRGFATQHESSTDKSLSELLREHRKKDQNHDV